MSDAKDGGGEEKAFDAPRIAINRVYTRHGDDGQTRLVGGQGRDKDDARIEAYGAVDELNAFVGLARDEALRMSSKMVHIARRDDLIHLADTLGRVQHELFNLGSILATLPEDVHPKQARITQEDINMLEREIDEAAAHLAPLRSFVLPGGAHLNAHLHVARTVCRRAERRAITLRKETEIDPLAIAYQNRLSDAFFIWSRYASRLLGASEVLWDPNRAAGASR
jgi:cob(I)alamin adenosyltransferase